MERNGELYCLKWNQFQINIFSALESLHLSEEFADVTLYCDGTSHKAHKVILSACSPYFKSVFMDHPHCTHPVIILKGVTYEDLNSLLTFMYQGEVNIQRERLPEFMRTAKLLQVRGLTNGFEFNDGSENQLKRTIHSDDTNTDSDSSLQGKKRIRIKRKSSLKNSQVREQHEPGGEIEQTNVTLPASEEVNRTLTPPDQNNDNKKCDQNEKDTNDTPLFGVKIKQEAMEVNDNMETQSSVASDYENEGSILQRSLIGDHTVKPAESLVITPDLPLPINPNNVKLEPEEPKSNNVQTPPAAQPPLTVYTKSTKKHHSVNDEVLDNFEDKLSSTLQLLKSNPQISVSREHADYVKLHPGGGTTAKMKSSQYEIQPQISIEPMKQVHSENNRSTFPTVPTVQPPSSNSIKSILAQNLTKLTTTPSKQQYSTGRSSTANNSSDSSLSTLVQLFGQGGNASGGNAASVGGGGSAQSGAQSWNCPHCQQLYHNQSALKYHVRLVHSDFNNRLCCYLCPNSFTMRDSYKAHMLELHGIRH